MVLSTLSTVFCVVVESFKVFSQFVCVFKSLFKVLVSEVCICVALTSAALAVAIPPRIKLASNKATNNVFFVIIPPPMPDHKNTFK
ncbi:MAG: hypothetical protein ACXVHM_01920 [Methanobacterium sp.]